MTIAELQEKQGERSWVHGFVPGLQEALARLTTSDLRVTVGDGVKLPYSSVISRYSLDGKPTLDSTSYETDLLVSDTDSAGNWTPRVVIECKLGSVTTHDALSYAAKAATHKHLHPYLRYGVLVGRMSSIPPFLVKHGIDFDFLATWPDEEPDRDIWQDFISTLTAEVEASRSLQAILTRRRSAVRYRLLRRPLRLS